MRGLFIFLSSALVLLSGIYYIRSIFCGSTRPHRTTRFVLFIIMLITTLSLWGDRGSSAFWLALISTFQCMATFVISIKRGVGGWARLDIFCLVVAIFGVALWQLSSSPEIALMASIFADFIGCVPTIIKTYRLPKSEDWRCYAMDMVAGVISLAAVKDFSLLSVSFPIYIFLVNGLIMVLALP